jgi:serine/threonine protein kinase
MLRCPEPDCGHVNRPSARFCERCGHPLRDQPWSPLPGGHLMRGGTYRILEPLGKGGMGALYLAADTGAFGRKCVVKELLDYYDPTDPEEARQAKARFETEARLLAELSHPGIPRIYSYFSEGGRHYIVMEYIEGETLEQAVSHVDPLGRTVVARPLPAEEVVRHAIRICRVLEYLGAQATPVVHHDVKPANLIVEQTSGDVRLVDFGTARSRTRWAAQARLERGKSTIFGTEGYAAPEQYQGGSDPRSDVYALAATVYHLLTDDDPADHPFRYPELDRLPQPLAYALSRALHLEVGRRSTAQEFRQALETWLVPEDRTQPFVFRGGAAALTTGELVNLADQHWFEARHHLAAGDFARWFRDRNRHDLVAKARSTQAGENADAALESFLRRLDPRLPSPRLAVNPGALDFGRVTRNARSKRTLVLRNEGRGYAEVTLQASVPWLTIVPRRIGCLAGEEVRVTVQLEPGNLPLRRDHQAVLTCIPVRGARISIPVSAALSLGREMLHRAAGGLRRMARAAQVGARRGFSNWVRAFRSLIRSRLGIWLLVAETLVLTASIIALWWTWQETMPDVADLLWTLLVSLPLALVIACLLPGLILVAGTAAWEVLKSLAGRVGRNVAARVRSKS